MPAAGRVGNSPQNRAGFVNIFPCGKRVVHSGKPGGRNHYSHMIVFVTSSHGPGIRGVPSIFGNVPRQQHHVNTLDSTPAGRSSGHLLDATAQARIPQCPTVVKNFRNFVF
ncbi:hypothetical protein AX27061_3594 [Achromobacter xylosoxidans NBRC 15126 = ATCC 27061]|nr:hypothetical protein AX27061_3594 [Achromobacter xylosoxidans NBRC 15126 = ATCC 27061]CCH09309.1 hypothetical protein NH44784_053661 [Achromobacter xylosoxidans NH44784-1996]